MPGKEKAPLVRIFQKEGYGVKCGTWEVGSRSHRHIKLTSTYGTILTEHLLNAGRKTSDFQEARKSPYNQAGKKKKREGNWNGTCAPGRSLSGRETSGEKRALRELAARGEPEGAGVWCPLPGEHE